MSLTDKHNTAKDYKNQPRIKLKNPISNPLKLLDGNHHSNENNGLIVNKKQKFESFLTYRKRLSRLAIVQSVFFYEQLSIFSKANFTEVEKANEAYRTIIYFYKRMFFHQKYGTNKKNKKLEERFVRNTLTNCILNSKQIDDLIIKYLQKRWKLDTINSVIRAALRSAISEALFNPKKQYSIILSEYTNLMAVTLTKEKEVDFFNAILDNIIKDIKTNICKNTK